jgi:hypothetical protein
VRSYAVPTIGSVARCSEREVALLCVVTYCSDFFKMSQKSPLESVDTELGHGSPRKGTHSRLLPEKTI